MTTPDITLHIESLVLDGLAPIDQEAVGRAVQQALSQMLAQDGLPASWQGGGTIQHLNGGTINVSANAAPQAIGTAVAGAVYRGQNP